MKLIVLFIGALFLSCNEAEIHRDPEIQVDPIVITPEHSVLPDKTEDSVFGNELIDQCEITDENC